MNSKETCKPETNRITVAANGTLRVPDTPVIPFIEGDGIGPDIWAAAKGVLGTALSFAYGDRRRIIWGGIGRGKGVSRNRGMASE